MSLPVSDFVSFILAVWLMAIYMKRFKVSKNESTDEIVVENKAEGKEEYHRSYSYYTPRSGAAPRGMAPQAGASQMIDEEEKLDDGRN